MTLIRLYFLSSGDFTGGEGKDGALGATNGAASPAMRWRRVSPISENTLLQTAFSFFSVASDISVMRLSDCWLSLLTVVSSQEFEALSSRCLCSSMAYTPTEF